MAKSLELHPQPLEIALPRNPCEPNRAVIIEHHVEGAIPRRSLVIPLEPRTSQFGQPVQYLIVAAPDRQRLRRIKDEGSRDQCIDESV